MSIYLQAPKSACPSATIRCVQQRGQKALPVEASCLFSFSWLVTTNRSFIFFKSCSCYSVALSFMLACISDSTNLRQGCCLLSARLGWKYIFEIHKSLWLSSGFPLGWHGKERHMWCAVTSPPPSCGRNAGSSPNKASLPGSRQRASLRGVNKHHVPQLDWQGTVTANIGQFLMLTAALIFSLKSLQV